jgi:chitin disaccharide deacetylase
MRAIFLIAVIIALSVTISIADTNGSHVPPQSQTKNLVERLGYPSNTKLLIIHANDLAMAHSVNAATIKALESGLVRSGSVMVPGPWFPEIAAYARKHPDVDLGVHLTLSSEWSSYRWGPVLSKDRVPSLLESDGHFGAVGSQMNLQEVEAEIRAQIERAKAFGLQPTHLDSHQGTLYANRDLLRIFLKVGRDYKLPVKIARDFWAWKPFFSELLDPTDIIIDREIIIDASVPSSQWSKFYTDAIKSIQPGITEMIVHLGHYDDEMRAMTKDHSEWGAAWRQRDFQFIISSDFRRAIQENNIQLITWRELNNLVVDLRKP